ncbi:SPASM domain-containing protein [Brachyspira hyodysenteriae]|uniref:radical SAM/SPASM domain-containing protein n=1 Tax=Brachyspira hyodysenteriae TaxID=159 RepID=UPI001183D1B9|nr:radical SAM/SPASM domain-containing protein [Brachyspira hyodysenteriae]MBT8720404.1 SPASM domain-containing protein [Brachyspira hyodysenteriae]MBT8730715.1 SPASM domain-containing protein [Brachyspira hyodysenteriae]MBT8732991.1 SPASM domain-containing protein [Brachyspira hyodysenteriae]MBT8735844.1 SPASM domain-containing protein [Brachyspira hyodysenteriae]MBT8738462.1 SPASM domain-containing protein [Brachyspira hyodysenteriae]
MKKFRIFIDKYFLSKIEKINPYLYRFLTLDLYRWYSDYYNLIKYKDKYFFNIVSVEISTYCNRKCHYCPNKDYDTPKEFMQWNVFEHIIEELKKIDYTGLFCYHRFNEPLFDDRLAEFSKYVSLHLPKATQVLISNGDILNIEKAIQLSEAGIDKFVVTVHDKNPERNLERLKPVKKILKEKMRLQTSNEIYLANRGGAVDIEKEDRKTNFKKCPDIRSLIITKDGDITLCCQDYFKKYVMGNVMEKSILDIWNSYKDIREKLLKYNIAELPICKVCLSRE